MSCTPLARISHQHSSQFGQTVFPNVEEPSEGRVKSTLPRMALKADGQSGRMAGEKCGLALIQDDPLGQTREDFTAIASYEQAFETILADSNHLILVAESDDKLLGCVQISYLPNLTFKGTWRAHLEGVRIKSDCRRQGLGKQLIKEAIALAKARGCGIVQLNTNKTRPKAIAFYEQLGFKDTHAGMKLYSIQL